MHSKLFIYSVILLNISYVLNPVLGTGNTIMITVVTVCGRMGDQWYSICPTGSKNYGCRKGYQGDAQCCKVYSKKNSFPLRSFYWDKASLKKLMLQKNELHSRQGSLQKKEVRRRTCILGSKEGWCTEREKGSCQAKWENFMWISSYMTL